MKPSDNSPQGWRKDIQGERLGETNSGGNLITHRDESRPLHHRMEVLLRGADRLRTSMHPTAIGWIESKWCLKNPLAVRLDAGDPHRP